MGEKTKEVKTVDSEGSNSNQKQPSCEADQLTVEERKSENRKSTKTRKSWSGFQYMAEFPNLSF